MDQDRIGIEFITVLGMPPVEFVHLAADLGVRHIGLGLAPIVAAPDAAPWSLREDAGLRRAVAEALRARGVGVSVGEALIAKRAVEADALARDLDLFAELGAACVNMISIDGDRARAFDGCARFAALAAARGLSAVLEYMPGPAIGDLPTALAAIDHAGQPGFRLLVDAMHLFRAGGTVADLAAVDPARLGYFQLCDVPLVSTAGSYGEEAATGRLDPGEGELPLADLLPVIPADQVISLEAPKLAVAVAGLPIRARLEHALAATRALLATIPAT